jgi:hypothetical protein
MIFPGQKKGEYIEFVFRKHWIVHVRAILHFMVIGVNPTLLLFFVLSKFDAISDKYYPLLIMFVCTYIAFAMQYSLIKWLNDDLDFLIITNERVIDITQIDFLSRDTSECTLDQIQDVIGEVIGIIGTLFNCGTVHIHTANDNAIFDLDVLSDPLRAASMILSFVKKGKAYRDYKKHSMGFKERILSLFK